MMSTSSTRRFISNHTSEVEVKINWANSNSNIQLLTSSTEYCSQVIIIIIDPIIIIIPIENWNPGQFSSSSRESNGIHTLQSNTSRDGNDTATMPHTQMQCDNPFEGKHQRSKHDMFECTGSCVTSVENECWGNVIVNCDDDVTVRCNDDSSGRWSTIGVRSWPDIGRSRLCKQNRFKRGDFLKGEL